MTEKAFDQDGNLLWEKPYIYSRLFACGQKQIVDRQEYETIFCEKHGDEITHVLRGC